MNSIKMVAFDLFGVILTEGHLISNGLMPLLPKGTERKQMKALYEQFNVAQISEAEFWSFSENINIYEIRRKLLYGLALDPEFESVIQTLSNHFQLSILSNLPPDWADVLMDRFKFNETFATCLFSGHQRCKKPDPQIYQKLIEQSGVSARDIVFIDDRLSNLFAAHQLGMATIYYQREDEINDFQADFTIQTLPGLLDILPIATD